MMADGRPLRGALEDYLALRRALGFRLKTAGRLLGQFVSWLEDRGASTITTADALEWATLPDGASQAWQSIRLSMVRGFAAYLHGTDPSVQVPPPGLIRRGNDRATPVPEPFGEQSQGHAVLVEMHGPGVSLMWSFT